MPSSPWLRQWRRRASTELNRHRLYLLFIDFEKAFDTVPHATLLAKLLLEGVGGKVFGILRDMYSAMQAMVRLGCEVASAFDVLAGVRQGCVLSPGPLRSLHR